MKRRLALTHGKIFTGVHGSSEVEALIIEDGKIMEVGSTSQVLEMLGGNADIPVVELGGRTAIPGFVDSHNHVLSAATLLEGVNCFGLKSIDELKAALAAKAAESEPGEWIIGAGWIESPILRARLPTRWDLDDAAPENPVTFPVCSAWRPSSKALRRRGSYNFVPRPVESIFEPLSRNRVGEGL